MARDIRIERRGARPDGRSPDAWEPGTTGEARRAIEETRGRISATLDEIEDRIDETRQQIKEKMDVARPVRERMRARPLPGLGLAVGAGLVLGLLSGGMKKRRARRRRGMIDEEERGGLRRWRSERRERLRRRRGRGARGPSMIGQLGRAVASAALAGVALRVRRAVTGARAREREEGRIAA
ncbi:MAG TPA: hypothetical protein VF158_06180 [Longimicrobiales bacterium]